jgi:AcrR family transcriptional regulator
VPVSRWAPNARERLESAALDLFVKNGYEETTVAQIADRAGLNRATFFRHFADKREVLFGGEDVLAGLFVNAKRGTDELSARMGAEMGILAFSVAFERWMSADDDQPFPRFADVALSDVQARAAELVLPSSGKQVLLTART